MEFRASFYEECVSYALHNKGYQAKDFEDTPLRVYQRRVANKANIFKALSKGGIVIPIIHGSLLDIEGAEPVATVLLAADNVKQQVTLYNPVTQTPEYHNLQRFIKAWEDGGGLCTTAFLNTDAYRPKLLNLEYVQLPADINELLEAMAENAHDRWALERQSEGWTYGPERDDQLILTPDMVPYGELSESEKEYDRIMATDTLRLLFALGYKLVKG